VQPGKLGNDPRQLEDLGRRLRDAADLLDHVGGTVHNRFHSTSWCGPDADDARHGWESSHRRALHDAVASLREAGHTLERNAVDQEHTSAAGTASLSRTARRGGKDNGWLEAVDHAAEAVGIGSALTHTAHLLSEPYDRLAAKTARAAAAAEATAKDLASKAAKAVKEAVAAPKDGAAAAKAENAVQKAADAAEHAGAVIKLPLLSEGAHVLLKGAGKWLPVPDLAANGYTLARSIDDHKWEEAGWAGTGVLLDGAQIVATGIVVAGAAEAAGVAMSGTAVVVGTAIATAGVAYEVVKDVPFLHHAVDQGFRQDFEVAKAAWHEVPQVVDGAAHVAADVAHDVDNAARDVGHAVHEVSDAAHDVDALAGGLGKGALKHALGFFR
jgi:hypothetical protein